jgi:hypothetical protein
MKKIICHINSNGLSAHAQNNLPKLAEIAPLLIGEKSLMSL